MSVERSGRASYLHRHARAWAALVAAAALCGGCNEDEALRAFRDAAASSLQSGLTSIASGVIDGAFAVFELGSDQGADGG
ncbi:MAG TPA: hypothetical protein PKC49_04310 [Phycisphaerae bacterium]|nr:hypothetical protein [Phycisphaerae bacterium]